ncbi:hypothetical protein [Pseudarthrobacter phenanthrenivorans]|uniref:hypothetical protein n=1 Tax=Pseudarthrobacter phenanthrenivorans TaxID=361575 RepID=UPI0020B74941|nr:hypothetical protein [Pseudarthrobacter phenanthrenivorans]
MSGGGKGGVRWLGWAAIGVLALVGCSPGTPAPGASPSESPATAPPASPSTGSGSSGFPEKAFTDAELAAVINGVGQSRNLPYPAAQDTGRLRSGASSGSFPQVGSEATPPECAVFAPQNPFVRWADKSVSFAEGAMPIGGASGPTTTIMISLRSAEKDAITKADFSYTEDLAARCKEFDFMYTESGRTSTYTVGLLDVAPVGEKYYGTMQTTKPKGPGDYGLVGLRVLAGTMSISLSLSVAALDSAADAKPALDSMSGLAKQLIDQAVQRPPTVAPAAANSMTPEDLVALAKGVTGPNGNTVELFGASVIGPAPGFTGGTPSQEPLERCTLSDAAYYGSLTGAVIGQGQIPGATKMEYIDVTMINMPAAAVPPYPFDSRAAEFRECETLQEDMGGSVRPFPALSRLTVSLAADASYAVAHQLSDGTGEWHVRAGARKGMLSVEASTRLNAQTEAQATADGLMEFFGKVFSSAGL